jgi:hypothetical protein
MLVLTVKWHTWIEVEHGGESLRVKFDMKRDGSPDGLAYRLLFEGPESFAIHRENAKVKHA